MITKLRLFNIPAIFVDGNSIEKYDEIERRYQKYQVNKNMIKYMKFTKIHMIYMRK